MAIRIEPIAGAIYGVSWQEANKTTVVHVENFAARAVVTHITRADGTFLQFRGTFVELP